AQSTKRLPLHETETRARCLLRQFAFDDRRQREVDVVAAEEQVLADRDALERHLAARRRRAQQAAVGRSAADAAPQEKASTAATRTFRLRRGYGGRLMVRVSEQPLEIACMRRDPRVHRRQ